MRLVTVAVALTLCCLGCQPHVNPNDKGEIKYQELSIVEKDGYRFAVYLDGHGVAMVLLPNDKKGSNE